MRKWIQVIVLLSAVTANEAQHTDFPKLTGPYLGQKPPGMIPEIFAPGIISKRYFERSVVFAPDQSELYFQLRCLGFTSVIIQLKQENGIWSKPETAPFSGIPEYSDDAPFFSYDGKILLLNSDRPLSGKTDIKKDSDIWMIHRDAKNLGEPFNAGNTLNSDFNEFYPTISKMNNLYFSSNRNPVDNTDYDIFVSHYSGSSFSEPIRLDSLINTKYFEGHPFIASDESYLIFSSDRPGELGQADLYISFKDKENKWLSPVNMGSKINSSFHEAAPYVSPDGKFLFFCSFKEMPPRLEKNRLSYGEIIKLLNGPENGYGDIYWVSTEVIEQLRPKE